ncbi:MAG: hypothetical protein ACLRM9_10415 [Collinsella aerofaciens]
MNYGWIEGSPEFKAEAAKLYRREVIPIIFCRSLPHGCQLNAIMAVVEPATM